MKKVLEVNGGEYTAQSEAFNKELYTVYIFTSGQVGLKRSWLPVVNRLFL